MITRTQTENSIIWKKVVRAFGGAVTTILSLSDSGSAQLNGSTMLTQGNMLPFYATGRNGAGNITVTGLKPGDKVIMACNITDAANGISSFTTTIATADVLVQTSASDLSTKKYLLLVVRP